MKQYKLAGSFYQKKNFCLITTTFSCHSLNPEGLDKVVLQNSLCIWQTQSKLESSLFYTREYKVASYKGGQVASPEDEEQGNKSTLYQYLLPTYTSALTCGRVYLF